MSDDLTSRARTAAGLPPPAGGRDGAADRQRNRAAILAMMLASFLYGISDAAMKMVAGTLATGQSVVFRSAGVVLVIGIAAAWTGALGAVVRTPWRLMLPRGVFDAGNSLFFQTALARMSLPDAMSILQISPLAMTAVSALALGAKVGWRRWGAVAAGFLGALLIIKPGTSAFNVFGLLVIASALCGTGRDVLTRMVPPTMPPLAQLLVSQAIVGVIAAIYGLLEVWQVPSLRQAAFLIVGSVFFAAGHLATIYAVRDSDWSVVAPFRYTGVLWAVFLGFMLWGDVPDGWSSVGVGILVWAGLYTLHRERVRSRQRKGEAER